MRILLAQINPTIGDLKGNARLISQGIEKARAVNAAIIIFPELSLTGYPPEDFLLLPHFMHQVNAVFHELISEVKGLTAIIGLPRSNRTGIGKPLFNSAAVVTNGQLLGYQDKTLLPTYDVFDEERYFETNQSPLTLWNLAGKKVGITICEDIWQHGSQLKMHYQTDPIQALLPLKPELLLNLSASPYSQGKFQSRLSSVQAAARTLKCPTLLCNQIGGNDSLIFDGTSIVVNAQGELIQSGQKFKEDFILFDTEAKHEVCHQTVDSIGDLHDALVLGLRDYMRKAGFSKVCLGLSGGIDSALVAALAVSALGAENVLGVLMPSRYSSEGSTTDAKALASHLGIPTYDLPIEEPFASFLETLNPLFAGYKEDITEENLQSRIRGTLLMALSNKFGHIVLSTGNKSEMAMGYSTLYGDLCGGLAVLSDVTKQQVYALSRYINREREVIPANSIHKPPSAELRPNQKDSDSLPDYSIIDNVLQDYIEDHLSPEDIAAKHGYPLEQVQMLILRIHRNEYKRRQAPPGLRVSEKAFSVGRRFPIVQKFCSWYNPLLSL